MARPRLPALVSLAALTLAAAAAGCRPAVVPAGVDDIARIEDERQPTSELLVEALRDPDSRRRERAALAMGRIQSTGYVDALIAALNDPERDVRRAAMFALGQLGLAQGGEVPEAAVAAATRALDDGDTTVVVAAVQALGKLATAATPATLVPLLGHAEPAVRAEAALALFRCRFAPLWRGDSDEPPPLPPPAVRALIDAVDDAALIVRRAAIYAFSRYGQPEAAADLGRHVADDDEWVRLFAVRGIGNSGDPAKADALRPALEDSSEQVRAEAIAAVAALDAGDTIPPSLASDPSFHVRAALAAAYGTGRAPVTLETLHALERDPSAGVRAAAIGALARRLGPAFHDGLSGPATAPR